MAFRPSSLNATALELSAGCRLTRNALAASDGQDPALPACSRDRFVVREGPKVGLDHIIDGAVIVICSIAWHHVLADDILTLEV